MVVACTGMMKEIIVAKFTMELVTEEETGNGMASVPREAGIQEVVF